MHSPAAAAGSGDPAGRPPPSCRQTGYMIIVIIIMINITIISYDNYGPYGSEGRRW